jgi:hypothetical protein
MSQAAVPPATSTGLGTPPIVLLHAFPLDGRMWAPQVDALAPDCQVLLALRAGGGRELAPLWI